MYFFSVKKNHPIWRLILQEKLIRKPDCQSNKPVHEGLVFVLYFLQKVNGNEKFIFFCRYFYLCDNVMFVIADL